MPAMMYSIGFFLLQLVAGLGEGPADKQEETTDCDVKQVEHTNYSLSETTT